ncbi:trypco2 family protein [Streptomyces mirabilis]|uniref:trypco2 family protein n=1 Tax=Streptomyces mirabilis TaxID=68239 RepID=UPI00332F6278
MIELASVIRDLRDELEGAVAAGAGEALQFELGLVELEVTLAVERSGGVGAKVRFWVVEMGVDAKQDAAHTQRIKLSLTPRLAEGSATPYVSGEAEARER